MKTVLRKGDWGLIIGWPGEKTLFKAGWTAGIVGKWTEVNAVASFGNEGLKIASETAKQVVQRTDGAV